VIFILLTGQLPAILAVVYTGFLQITQGALSGRIIRDLPLKAKKDRFFYNYMLRIKKRFNALYSLDDIGKINSSKG